jgi:hypothetical protein
MCCYQDDSLKIIRKTDFFVYSYEAVVIRELPNVFIS